MVEVNTERRIHCEGGAETAGDIAKGGVNIKRDDVNAVMKPKQEGISL
jgi:hypothetical protein